ncbi:MAG: type II toxin-antitoxin system RelE/ParE family toxin [Opitutae bacterium]|nr:type II toxin-antitoxin system RelE/ParE family toxin [Opitutae bacterium]
MKLTFIELPLFTSLVTQITDDHHLRQLQNDLLKTPEKGNLIHRLHGLRKVRMALAGKGRSGGARVIYLYLPQHHTVIFFYIYTKAKSENLTSDQERRLRAAVETIKQEYRHENQRD